MSPLVVVASKLPPKAKRNLLLIWVAIVVTITLVLVIREALR